MCWFVEVHGPSWKWSQALSIKYDMVLQAVGAGFIALWLYDVITSNLTGHRVLHQAGTGQVCVDCTASTTTPGSFDCTTCAAAGTAGAPQFGCPTCTASTTVPGSFDCTGCEGYTCATCTPGTTPNSFTCTTCVDALTAATTPAVVPPVPTTDPCSTVTTPCIYVDAIKDCAHQGNSACKCSGCKKPSTSTPKPAAAAPAPAKATITPRLTFAQPVLKPRLAPFVAPKKICPPLVAC